MQPTALLETIGVWKRCGNTRVSVMPVNHVSFSQGHSNDVSSGHIVPPGYGTDVVDWVGSKAANCNPQLLETRWGLERILKHSCGTVLPTNHVSIGQEHFQLRPT